MKKKLTKKKEEKEREIMFGKRSSPGFFTGVAEPKYTIRDGGIKNERK